MPKRRPTSTIEPLDIFDSPRLSNAIASATSSEPLGPPVSGAQESAAKEGKSDLRPVPSAPESAPAERAKQPSQATEPAPKQLETEVAKSRKGRAEAEEEPEPEKLPEPNVPLKFRVPQTLRSEFQTFKAEFSAALGGVVLDDSNLGRPLLEHFLVDQRDRILEAAAGFKGKLRRPRARPPAFPRA